MGNSCTTPTIECDDISLTQLSTETDLKLSSIDTDLKSSMSSLSSLTESRRFEADFEGLMKILWSRYTKACRSRFPDPCQFSNGVNKQSMNLGWPMSNMFSDHNAEDEEGTTGYISEAKRLGLRCAVDEKYGKTNELHQLVLNQKWQELRRVLWVRDGVQVEGADKMQTISKEKVDFMIRQVDEFGRTPLALACGASSAPVDIIRTMIDQDSICARTVDTNGNLPIHHFCHSYELQNDKVSDGERYVFPLLHQTCPVGLEMKNSFGNTPLHIFLEHRSASNMRDGTVEFVLNLLNMNPKAASVANNVGSYPMHNIGVAPQHQTNKEQVGKVSQKKKRRGSRSGTEEIKSLVLVGNNMRKLVGAVHDAYPEAIRSRNKSGATPFFTAVVHQANIETWNAMLSKYPGAAFERNNDDMSPLVAHWNIYVNIEEKKKLQNLGREEVLKEGARISENLKEMSSITSIDQLRMKGSPDLVEFWNKVILLLRVGCNGNASQRKSNGNRLRAVHALSSISDCPTHMLKFALRLHPSEARETDVDGNTPLHIVAGLGSERSKMKECNNIHSLIKRLIGVYPNAARQVNYEGCLPLHIALKSGKSWDTGIESLLLANEKAIRVRAPETGLYPFMIAATLKPSNNDSKAEGELDDEPLNTVFALLRAEPNMVFPDKFLSEIAFQNRNSDDYGITKLNNQRELAKPKNRRFKKKRRRKGPDPNLYEGSTGFERTLTVIGDSNKKKTFNLKNLFGRGREKNISKGKRR